MNELASSIRSTMVAIDAAHAHPPSRLSDSEKMYFSVAYACRLFVEFLTIHPYANGNGHVARWLLLAVLRRHGYRLNNFPVEPRPPDPPYSNMISRYRNGEVELLEKYVLSRLS
jgi:Fic family protein